VRTAFLKAHPDAVERLLKGVVDATTYVQSHPTESQKVVNAGILEITGKSLSDAVITSAWKNLHFTTDPLLSTLEKEKAAAVKVGLLSDVSLKGIANLAPLNKALQAAGEPEVRN